MRTRIKFNPAGVVFCRFGPMYPIARLRLPEVVLILGEGALIKGGHVIRASDVIDVTANLFWFPNTVTVTYRLPTGTARLRIYPGMNLLRRDVLRVEKILK